MKVLMTAGGSGFAGSFFVRYFLRRNKGFIIVNIDKAPDSEETIKALATSPRYHHIKGDICNFDLIDYIMRRYRPDYIVNFIDEDSHGSASHSMSLSNVAGTHSLIESALETWGKSGFQFNRFIQVSSDEVYGENSEGQPFTEDAFLNPCSPHAASKASADLLSMSYAKAFGFPSVTTRLCSLYGPGQKTGSFIPEGVRAAFMDKPIEIHGDGSITREWMHVQDGSTGIIRAMFYGRPGEVYNLGSGEEASYNDLASRLLEKLKKPRDMIKKVPISNVLPVPARFGLDSSRARARLKWTPKYTVDEWIEESIARVRNSVQ